MSKSLQHGQIERMREQELTEEEVKKIALDANTSPRKGQQEPSKPKKVQSK